MTNKNCSPPNPPQSKVLVCDGHTLSSVVILLRPPLNPNGDCTTVVRYLAIYYGAQYGCLRLCGCGLAGWIRGIKSVLCVCLSATDCSPLFYMYCTRTVQVHTTVVHHSQGLLLLYSYAWCIGYIIATVASLQQRQIYIKQLH